MLKEQQTKQLRVVRREHPGAPPSPGILPNYHRRLIGVVYVFEDPRRRAVARRQYEP